MDNELDDRVILSRIQIERFVRVAKARRSRETGEVLLKICRFIGFGGLSAAIRSGLRRGQALVYRLRRARTAQPKVPAGRRAF
jgi:hypothetical protein